MKVCEGFAQYKYARVRSVIINIKGQSFVSDVFKLVNLVKLPRPPHGGDEFKIKPN